MDHLMTTGFDWDAFDTPLMEKVDRDHLGRPLIVPPEGGRAVPYTRCTTFAGKIEDEFGLNRWKQRMTAIGVASRPDLILSVNAHRDDRKALDGFVRDAMDAAKAGVAASIGTSLHKLTEYIDRGEPLPPVPAEYVADLLAYREAMAPLKVTGIERFTVLDDLRIGGTHDRTAEYLGRTYIDDLKTGSIAYAELKIAIQLAIYSRSVVYTSPGPAKDADDKWIEYTPEQAAAARTPLGVDQDRAIVCHLPAGTGTGKLYWVNIAEGWNAVRTVVDVEEWRKRKDLFEEWPHVEPDLSALIAGAPDRATIEAIWARHVAAWTDDLTALAKDRIAALTAGRTTANV
jgi:hypothetical protein